LEKISQNKKLLVAAEKGDYENAKKAIDAGAFDCECALICAAYRGDKKMVALLVESGGRMNLLLAFEAAIKNNFLDIAEYLGKKINLKALREGGLDKSLVPPLESDSPKTEHYKTKKNKRAEECVINLDDFCRVDLQFEKNFYENIFYKMNDKTLKQMLEKKKYLKLKEEVLSRYELFLNESFGKFLETLKKSHDKFYERFLNKYGDKKYCCFNMIKNNNDSKKGLYAFWVDKKMVYIGRCKGKYNFDNRINLGYGKISPYNCLLDGQSTNCRVNKLIQKCLEDKKKVELLVLPLLDDALIINAEKGLISKYQPLWNVQ